MAVRQQGSDMSQDPMPPPQSPIPIDPSLALYSSPYPSFPQSQQQMPQPPSEWAPGPNLSSSSPLGSDATMTPPVDPMSYNSPRADGRKRPSSALSGTSSDARKKSRKDETDALSSPTTEKEEQKAKPTRGSRACTVCRRLKMKCVGAEQGGPCKRCQAGNHECIFEESNRGKRSANAKKHEQLSRSLRKMEKTLDTVLRSIGNPSLAADLTSRSPSPTAQNATHALLESPSSSSQVTLDQNSAPLSPKLHSLPDNSLNPLGLLAEASLANRRAQAASRPYKEGHHDGADDHKVGVANETYFKPGPMTILPLRRLYIERQVQPEMLSFVSTEEVVALFKIYFDHMNIHAYLLDSDFHTPSLVCSRSPFLLTTICAIAAKFYSTRPELHPRLSELSRKLAFSVPAQGYKSVEIVQAYLLLSLWGCDHVERFEHDMTWMILGMAIRMAMDLNLHRKMSSATAETPEGKARDREIRNRERTWLLCFCLDRSLSAQMGKPHSIKEDFIIRDCIQWYEDPSAGDGDASLAAYTDLQRIMARSLDTLYSGTETASGIQPNCDYLLIIKTMETQLLAWHHQWLRSTRSDKTKESMYKDLMGPFYFNYSMLVLNSFGLQNSLERSAVDIGHFFARCHSSAVACATLVRDHLAPKGYLRYSPDSHFVFISYAVLSLLKLVRPEFQAFLDHGEATIGLVKDVVDLLGQVAASPTHTPALYSVLLNALLSAKVSHKKEEGPDFTFNHTSSEKHAPYNHIHEQQSNAVFGEPSHGMEFQFESEMGPAADISTFPPTMAADSSNAGMLSMDSILSAGFWDNLLVPGYSSTFEGLSGGFVYGAGGSGLITPRLGMSPLPSGANTPSRGRYGPGGEFTQQNLAATFDGSPKESSASV